MHANQHFTAQIIAKWCFFRSSCYSKYGDCFSICNIMIWKPKIIIHLGSFLFLCPGSLRERGSCNSHVEPKTSVSSVFIFFWSWKNILWPHIQTEISCHNQRIELTVLEWKVLYQRSQMKTIILSKVYSFIVAKQQLWYICNLWTKWKVHKYQ